LGYKKQINIVWIGKTKEGYLQTGIEKYIKLLKPFADIEIKTLKEEKHRGSKEKALKKESDRLIKSVKKDFILLSERGILMNSMEFAGFVNKRSNLTFVLGGPFGVDKSVYEKADVVLSLSPMTFTHEMARLILLEQLYRAITIIHGKGYHY
jgi:23S rRNA (pseudouridine1915-N3)-methyltransferase